MRFARLREEAAKEFNERIGEHFNRHFHGMEHLRGIIIGGPGMTKDVFSEGGYLHYELQGKILGTLDTVYTEEYGLRELVEKAEDILIDLAITQEKAIMAKFFQELVQETGLASYGEKEVKHFLALGAVDTLLLSEGLEKYHVLIGCKNCDYAKALIVDVPTLKKIEGEIPHMQCPDCSNQRMTIKESHPIEKELTEMAEAMNSDVVVISTETEEGKQLMQAFGGIAAILRYSGEASV